MGMAISGQPQMFRIKFTAGEFSKALSGDSLQHMARPRELSKFIQ